MTSSELISKMRSALDEPTSSFYTDTELYNYLTNAQRAVYSYLISMYRMGKKSLTGSLRELMSVDEKTESSPVSVIAFPLDFWVPLAVSYIKNGETVLREAKIVGGILFAYKQTNSYLNDVNTYSVAFNATEYKFSGTVSYRRLEYLKTPSDVSSLENPILNDDATDAVLYHALSNAFAKDAKTNMDVSGQYFNLFLKAVEAVQ